MATDVKWLKLMNTMFEDDKIEYIECLPDGDTILIIWIKILCLASKSNDNGSLMVTSEIPYTATLLASKFKKTQAQINYALSVMQNLGMIYIEDDVINVSNWSKYQSVDELSKIKEQTRLRVSKFRERQKLVENTEECNVTRNVTSNATVTLKCNENALISNSISSNNSKNYKLEIKEIIDYLNKVLNKNYRYNTSTTIKHITARLKENYKIEDFKKVIDYKSKEWGNSDFAKYLTPDTLFGTKFEKYLQQANSSSDGGASDYGEFDDIFKRTNV